MAKHDIGGEKGGEITLYEHTIIQIKMLRGHSVYMPLHIYKVHLGAGIHCVIKWKASQKLVSLGFTLGLIVTGFKEVHPTEAIQYRGQQGNLMTVSISIFISQYMEH